MEGDKGIEGCKEDTKGTIVAVFHSELVLMKYIQFSLSLSFSAADFVIFKTSTYSWVGHHTRNI